MRDLEISKKAVYLVMLFYKITEKSALDLYYDEVVSMQSLLNKGVFDSLNYEEQLNDSF